MVTSTAQQALQVSGLGRASKVNVLALLGQAFYQAKRGNRTDAAVFLGVAMLATKYKNASYALQGLLAADRVLGGVTGERPLHAVQRGLRM